MFSRRPKRWLRDWEGLIDGSQSLMPVSVVDVRIMRMGVRHRLVPVPMSVRRRVGYWGVGKRVDVIMMFVV